MSSQEAALGQLGRGGAWVWGGSLLIGLQILLHPISFEFLPNVHSNSVHHHSCNNFPLALTPRGVQIQS